MSTNEILAFLLPGNDPIQIIFGSSIMVLGTITLVMMFLGARRAIWEKKWNGSGADDLDVEHGSVNEISAAVASSGEKMADIMPGILLILGLLGTFLGLGIALNKASTILIEANAGGGMDNAMTSLMGMMEGLGTKFKTSTWGLIAFLVIKAFASLSRYDERRLRWCISKMKAAFEQSRQAMRDSHEHDQQALLTTLSKIDQTLLDQLQASRKVLEQHVQLSQHGTQATTTALTSTRQAIEDMQQALLSQLQALNTNSLDTRRSLGVSTKLLQRHSEQSQQQLQASYSLLEQHFQASQREAQASVTALNGTHQAIADMQQALLPQLQTLNANSLDACRSLGETTVLLQHHSEQNQLQLDDSHATRSSLESFIEANSSNLSAISEAANQMAGAAGGIGQSADQLKMAIGEFKSSVGEVLDGLKRDLAGTIDNMGESFAHNMSNISTTMAEATSGISGAVSDLSENVGKTMTSVQQSNETSIEIQKNAQREFLVTSSSLIENVEGMTTLVNDLRESILSGLRAVSENGRRMVSLDKRYSDVVEKAARSANALEHVSAQLAEIQQASPLQTAVGQMIQQINALSTSLDNIDKHFSALKESKENGEYINHICNAMDEVIVRLEGIDRHMEQITLESEGA
ncbi:hypothetical protein [Geopseudomonas aromaticivorans]